MVGEVEIKKESFEHSTWQIQLGTKGRDVVIYTKIIYIQVVFIGNKVIHILYVAQNTSGY